METGTLTFVFNDGDQYSFSADYLRAVRERIFPHYVRERISLLLCASMVAHDEKYDLGLAIFEAILEVEHGVSLTGTKQPSAFKRPPLMGLWHKHFTDARFLAWNYEYAARRSERLAIAEKVLPTLLGLPVEEQARIFVEKVWAQPLERRFAERKATGEWLVYFKRGDTTYYLTCCKHRTARKDQERLLHEILTVCPIDFPEICSWLIEAGNKEAARIQNVG